MLIGIGILGIASAAGVAVAVNRAVPQTRWTLPLSPEDAVWAADDTALYLHSADNVVRALDRAAGEVLWSVPGGQPTVSPSPYRNLAAPGTVLVVGTASGVAAFEAATGRRLWEMARSVTLSERIVAAEGIVLAVTEDSIVALDVATGNRLWTAAAPDAHLRAVDLAAGDGTGFLTLPGRLIALDLRTGQTAWTADTGRDSGVRVVVERGVVCLGYDDTVLALNAGTGQMIWNTRMRLVAAATREHFRVADGVLVAVTSVPGADWAVDGLDVVTGELRWTVPGVGFYRVITTGSALYATTKGGPMCAYDAATGEQRWTYGNWHYEPLAANGRDVYLLGEDEVHAIIAM